MKGISASIRNRFKKCKKRQPQKGSGYSKKSVNSGKFKKKLANNYIHADFLDQKNA